jgi:hypothetical protein
VGQDNEGGRQLGDCKHKHTVTTVTAGLARTVCEACGKVSIQYEGSGAVWPEAPGLNAKRAARGARTTEEVARPRRAKPDPARQPAQSPPPVCTRCDAPAIYLTPWGIACGDHAWQSASLQDPLSDSFWIPLLIDRSNIAH